MRKLVVACALCGMLTAVGAAQADTINMGAWNTIDDPLLTGTWNETYGDGTPGSGGRLLASGIFIDREPEVRRAFATAGLRVVEREQETDWVALDLERPGP